jgi:glutaminase
MTFVSTGRLPAPPAVHSLVDEAHARFAPVADGRNSEVYPALAAARPELFGVCVVSTGGDVYGTGLPGNSLVAIVTVSPGKGGLGTFAPPLDRPGNSVPGQRAARFLSRQLGMDLFVSAPALGE